MLPLGLGAVHAHGGVPTEQERLRRQQVVRLGVLLCLLLVMYDGSMMNSHHAPLGSKHTSDDSKPKPTPFTSRVNNVIGAQRGLSSYMYPRNVTGMYRGSWARVIMTPKQVSDQLQIVNASIGTWYDESSYSTPTAAGMQLIPPASYASSGKLLMQLKAVAVDNIPDMTFVYGVIKLYGAGVQSSDILYPLQGIFLSNVGTLSLLSSPYINQKLFLDVPANDGEIGQGKTATELPVTSENPSTSAESHIQDTKNSSSGIGSFGSSSSGSSSNSSSSSSSLDGNQTEARKDPGATEDVHSTRWLLDTETTTTRVKRNHSYLSLTRAYGNKLSAWLRDKMHLSAFGQLHQGEEDLRDEIYSLFELDENRHKYSTLHARHLLMSDPISSSAHINVAAIGSSGIHIIVAETASIGLVKHAPVTNKSVDCSNITTQGACSESYVDVLGEGDLPQSFRNLQSSAYHTLASSGVPVCQATMTLHADPLALNNKASYDKDLPLLPNVSNSPTVKLAPTSAIEDSFSSNLNGDVVSTECGMKFNITAASYHLQVDLLERKAINYSIMGTAVCLVQIGLLFLQLRYSQTQAMASKMSILGMCSQSLLDAMICVAHLLLCAAVPSVFFQHLMWIAILKLLMFCVFEMRMVVSIYQARYAQEISAEGWAGLRRRLATLHLRFYGALFFVMFLALTFHSKPVALVLLFYSCWLPQIVYNAVSGTRRAFHPVYLYGMASCRMLIPLYIYGCPSNFVTLLLVDSSSFSTSSTACFVLLLWTAAQVGVLTAQDTFGARFFVPKQFLPHKYDYFRIIPTSAISTTTQASSSVDVESGDLPECIICYNAIEQTHGAYMICPCDHLFHTDCLRTWMDVKLECPTCRCLLPSYESD